MPDFPVKRAPLPGDPDCDREMAAYEKALEARLFKKKTFPVHKYARFSQSEPLTGLDDRGDETMDLSQSVYHKDYDHPKLLGPPVEKYRGFSCPEIQRSPHFIMDHHDHGLALAKKSYDFGRRSD